ncbi:DUF7519 family protein [Halobacterium rubrum]|uniref:DUF7519 family protein n=1 Tax=Halobacterium TaxID=2239 RepID=UPI001F47287E|nr:MULTISPECIES: hypothetical protein [Halobacterium]MDH5020239.1 hypothetical protein [Halobacterium rubrum]
MSPSSQPTTVDESTWRPTRYGTGITVCVTTALTALVALALDQVVPLAAGWTAALSLTAGLWLATRPTRRVPARYLASLLVAPLGVAAVGGLAYTAVVVGSAQFPPSTPAGTASAALAVVAQVVVAAGLLTAVVGAASTIGGLVTRRGLRSLWRVTLPTLFAPLLAATVLTAAAVVGDTALTSGGRTVGTAAANAVDTATSFFRSPPAGKPNLSSLLLLAFAAATTLSRTLGSLPLELGLDDDQIDAVSEFRGALRTVSWVLTLAILVGVFVDLLLRDPQFRGQLDQSVYQYLVAGTQVEPLRDALAAVTVGCLGLLAVSYALKRVARTTSRASLEGYGPLLGGATITAATFAVTGPLVQRVQAAVVAALPPALTPRYQQLSEGVLGFYGPHAVTTVGLSLVVGSTVAVVTAIWVGMWLRLLPSKTTGPALAGAGLFVATTFAGVTGSLPAWLFFAGIVGSFVAWDSGHFAWQLGREVGRQTPTRNVEAVHLAGTLAVGVLATGAALGVRRYATTISFVDPTTIPAALAGSAAAIFLLVVALR